MNIINRSGADRDPFEQSDRGGFGKNAGKGDGNRSLTKKYFEGFARTNLGKGPRRPGRTIYRFPRKAGAS